MVLRVVDGDFLSGPPFQHLGNAEGFEYRTDSVVHNVPRLLEDLADVALVSAVEYAGHGDLVGLGFGVGYRERSDQLFLCANDDIRKLHTIYVPQLRSASLMLLRILLMDRWGVSPRLIPVDLDRFESELGDNEGLLLFLDEPTPDPACMNFTYCYDLVALWHEQTGLPLVFLIWATTQEVMAGPEGRQLREHVERWQSDEGADAIFRSVTGGQSYLLDSDMLKGLNHFLRLSCERGFSPACSYKGLMLDEAAPSTRVRASKGSDEVLQDAVDGVRLSISDALLLMNRVSLGDLGIAGNLLRRRLFSERTLSFCYILQERDYPTLDALVQAGKGAIADGFSKLVLVPNSEGLSTLSEYEEALEALSADYSVSVEGFGAGCLLSLAATEGITLAEVVSRLIGSGLSLLTSWGAGMLVERRDHSKQDEEVGATDWLEVIRSVHRYGAKSVCSMTVSPAHSWEERLVHLQRLRTLQDLTNGFNFFCVKPSGSWGSRIPTGLMLKVVVLGRLFLDNVPSIKEVRFSPDSVSGIKSLWFGANSLRVSVHPGQEEGCSKVVKMLAEALPEDIQPVDPCKAVKRRANF